jgi:glycosyltransferase involved in cell wall biosynthesis
MTPRVSVIVPTRNRPQSLALALASVEAQSLRAFEVLVVDDGSGDELASWLRNAHPEVRLIVMERPSGAAAARNRAVALARGDLVAFLDDDDRWRPSFLETQVAQLESNPDAEISSTGHVEIDGAGHVSHPDLRPVFAYADPLVHLLAECPIHTMSVVACRRRAFERVGGFDRSLEIAHDLEWYVRAVATGGRHVHCPAVLVERGVPGGLVARHRRWFAEDREVLRRAFAASAIALRHRRRIIASRALLFASVGFAKGDFEFGIARLAGALIAAPLDAARIVAVKAVRRLGRAPRSANAAWDVAAPEVR